MKIDKNEQYWFTGIDVCNILGLENPTQSVKFLDEDEKKLDYILDSSGQQKKREKSIFVLQSRNFSSLL